VIEISDHRNDKWCLLDEEIKDLKQSVSPANITGKRKATHRGLHKFTPRHPDEIDIDIGDPVYVQHEADDCWCEGETFYSSEKIETTTFSEWGGSPQNFSGFFKIFQDFSGFFLETIVRILPLCFDFFTEYNVIRTELLFWDLRLKCQPRIPFNTLFLKFFFVRVRIMFLNVR